MAPWLDDLAEMDDVVIDTFGDPVDHVITYTVTSGAPVPINGVFSNEYRRLDNGEADVSNAHPAVFTRMANLPVDPKQDDDPTVTVDGVDYQVTEVEPDGQGGVRLHLHKR